MAKKGGVQQLQADISTDEDFENFLERQGLLVLDVYSEWCGPCMGMVGSLRKIKLELGGDNLQLAICKSDTITQLRRFNKKSEPTWLFVTNGVAVNIMFGTDVPKLMNLITKELDKLVSKVQRTTYEITELQPIEVEQLRVKTEATEKAERILRDEREKKRTDYLRYVTDIIMENMTDIGITVFGPHVNRDMFKKLNEPAEALKMQCKDRKVITVTKSDFETVNFACNNPLNPDVIDQLDGKELLMCFWKVDESLGSVPNVLITYAHELTKEQAAPTDELFDEVHIVPPIISPLKVKVEVEVEDGEDWEDEESTEEKQMAAKARPIKSSITVHEEASHIMEMVEDLDGEEEGEEEDIVDGAERSPSLPPEMSFQMFDLDIDDDLGEEEEVEEVVEEAPKKLTRFKTVKLPPIWVPNNRRTHAALIYVFFRGQTAGFLPPDPKPEPPHVVMAFDAYKRKDLINVVDRHKDDVPLYGFFTSDDPEETKLIANSVEKYNESTHSPNDKIILKVNKVQSNTMLSLVSYGPSYVSPNIDVGHEEALRFFPENYKSAQQEYAERLQEEADKPKKKKKEKKEDGVEAHETVEYEEAMHADLSPLETAAEHLPSEEEQDLLDGESHPDDEEAYNPQLDNGEATTTEGADGLSENKTLPAEDSKEEPVIVETTAAEGAVVEQESVANPSQAAETQLSPASDNTPAENITKPTEPSADPHLAENATLQPESAVRTETPNETETKSQTPDPSPVE